MTGLEVQSALAAQGLSVLQLVAFRATPLAAFCAVSSKPGAARRALVWLGYAVVVGSCVRLDGTYLASFVTMVAGLTGYALLCLAVYGLARYQDRLRVPKELLLAVLGLVFVVLPAALLPRPHNAGAAFLVVGWDLWLASYSYIVENAGQRQTRARDALFFLLVDPTLVFPRRGTWSEPIHGTGRGALRIALGVGLLAVAPLPPLALSPQLAVGGAGIVHLYTAVLIPGMLQLLALYFAHSGLAHVQIGALGLLGFSAPERYRWPLLATGPIDFWQRWNMYVGLWLHRYVFVPVAMKKWPSRRLPGSLAVAFTFVFAGVLHDAFAFAVHGETHWPITQGFALAATTYLLWHAFSRLARGRLGARPITSWALFIHCLAAIVWWVDALGIRA